ncbi:alcohol dehydrogenase family protein [Agarivorans sp. 1_MG-2023]|uniref:alcohol dehydrogenase family protein n=1 Tax=Agarivorans sp. 1_MG-2023 TaxID=3062634 RepID=UPI0026E3A92B|nr:alcohol dehydrogenase family protein [Agarivorans sp. 1_MG-2023]MDO6763082.1 alcohol dehydrogenase family protein [Agarivorans sp. 1_MG-2023]
MTTLPNTMCAVQMTGHGDTDKLSYRCDVALPVIGPRDVLIKVAAAGVNNTDINTRIGWYSKSDNAEDASWSSQALQFPRIQGADVCGYIAAVGEEVDASRVGERVLIEPCLTEVNGTHPEQAWYFGSECDGGFAEYTKVAACHAYKINSKYSNAELASFPCSYSTAENLLTRAKVKQGDKVLITGASGGVGSAAIQLAKARGAYVLALTSQDKQQMIEELGVDEVVLRSEKLKDVMAANSVDVVIDLVAGGLFPQLLDVLRPKGRYAVSGAIGGAMVELDVRTLYLKDLSFFGCTVIEPEVFANLVAHIENEDIAPLVAHTYPLKEIVQAQSTFLEKKFLGKIVLTM